MYITHLCCVVVYIRRSVQVSIGMYVRVTFVWACSDLVPPTTLIYIATGGSKGMLLNVIKRHNYVEASPHSTVQDGGEIRPVFLEFQVPWPTHCKLGVY